MEKIIQINHHQDDHECMWNGIEDIYMDKTKEKIPYGFFFALAGYGKVLYLKNKANEFKVMPCFADGRTKKMYERISKTVGFTYKHIENVKFSYSMAKAKAEIDNGYPVILGPVDMGELPYFTKFYHLVSIPYHYIMMVGYNDEGVYIYDCGREQLIHMTYEATEAALNIKPTSLGGKNSICIIRMDHPNTAKSIFETEIVNNANELLYTKAKVSGIKALETMIVDFPKLETELGTEEYKKCMRRFVEFSGRVSALPNRLLGINAPNFIRYMGQRERIAEVVEFFGYKDEASLFIKSGEAIEQIVEVLVDYLLGEKDNRDLLPGYLEIVKESEKAAYLSLLSKING